MDSANDDDVDETLLYPAIGSMPSYLLSLTSLLLLAAKIPESSPMLGTEVSDD